MALSYDSMGVELLLLAGVLLATADYEKKLQLIFSGLAFAGAVLCNPYLASLWLLYAACMGAHLLLKNKDISIALKSEMFSVRAFLFFTAGVAALAVVFLIFTLYHRLEQGAVLLQIVVRAASAFPLCALCLRRDARRNAFR